MRTFSLRSGLAFRAGLSHLIGLCIADLYGTVGTTAGFGSGFGVGVFAGGIISIPLFLCLCVVIWIFAEQLERNVVAFCIGGPALVCSLWRIMSGSDLLAAVAISSVTASVAFLGLTAIERRISSRQSNVR
jgi:hypothetical protein